MECRIFALTVIVLLSAVTTIYAQTLWGICPDQYKRYNPMHSYCLRSCCSCPFSKKDVSEGMKKHILYLHNSYRSKVAGGYPYGVDHLSRASNMLEMEWDDELANIAQKWAYSCPGSKYDCDLCRMVDRFPVGQIVIEVEGRKMENDDLDIEFTNFFSGLTYVKKEHMANYNPGDGKGRYAQLLWAKTWRIGCGYLYYNSDGRKRSTLVCNYGPAPTEDEEVYKAGSACSACPANSCCGKDCKKHGIEAKYNGLCKVIDASKPPEGDVPHKKTGKELFYCAFNGESDCSYIAEGIDFFSTRKSPGGTALIGNIRSGWSGILHFTSPIKSKSGNVCIKIVTRKGPVGVDQKYNYEMGASLEKRNRYRTDIGFPKVQEKTKFMYQIDYIQPDEFPKNEDVELSLAFSVPSGSPEQYFEIDKIIAEEKKCKKVTTAQGTGYIVTRD